jgi:hypothetical protein
MAKVPNNGIVLMARSWPPHMPGVSEPNHLLFVSIKKDFG